MCLKWFGRVDSKPSLSLLCSNSFILFLSGVTGPFGNLNKSYGHLPKCTHTQTSREYFHGSVHLLLRKYYVKSSILSAGETAVHTTDSFLLVWSFISRGSIHPRARNSSLIHIPLPQQKDWILQNSVINSCYLGISADENKDMQDDL